MDCTLWTINSFYVNLINPLLPSMNTNLYDLGIISGGINVEPLSIDDPKNHC